MYGPCSKRLFLHKISFILTCMSVYIALTYTLHLYVMKLNISVIIPKQKGCSRSNPMKFSVTKISPVWRHIIPPPIHNSVTQRLKLGKFHLFYVIFSPRAYWNQLIFVIKNECCPTLHWLSFLWHTSRLFLLFIPELTPFRHPESQQWSRWDFPGSLQE